MVAASGAAALLQAGVAALFLPPADATPLLVAMPAVEPHSEGGEGGGGGESAAAVQATAGGGGAGQGPPRLSRASYSIG
jgi:hypothetical protein